MNLLHSRFPIVSGFVVEWNSKNSSGQRVLGVWLAEEGDHHEGEEEVTKGEEVKRETGGKIYRIMTREYMGEKPLIFLIGA